uniref:Integrin subunit alpha 7 n=1 Tax=Ailuropoda melanoleuca TaxID=9646 RepID=A0A7N5KFZ2_AILME
MRAFGALWRPAPSIPGPVADQAHRLANVSHQWTRSLDEHPKCWEPGRSSGRSTPSRNCFQTPCSLLSWKGDRVEIRVPIPPESSHPPPLLLPSSLDIPVWLLPSEQPELIFSHQLSPGPSGCAALGRGSWGPRDCGMGFFKRARYPEATVPQYHAVKIPREDRQQFKEEKTGTILRNNWGSPRREGPDAHPILAADGHPEPGSDGHPVSGTA